MSEGRRYRVIETVGKGGYGTVYRAELIGKEGFTKTVAVKLLNSGVARNSDVARRLRDEARLLGLLRHRAIVHVDDLVQFGRTWGVVMEFVDGVDLALIRKAGPIPVGPSLEVVAEVAGALWSAWEQPGPDGRNLRLLHRDIKPSNIQVTRHGEVKVLDFGIARADFVSREAHTTNEVFGSTGYVAPERLDLIEEHASDIYSLGVVLYEILCEQRFGKTLTAKEQHDRRLAQCGDHLRTHGVSEEVIDVFRAMMAFDHAARPNARDVERSCTRLARAAGGDSLKDWAEQAIPPMIAGRGTIRPDVSESMLIEIVQSGEIVPSDGPPPLGAPPVLLDFPAGTSLGLGGADDFGGGDETTNLRNPDRAPAPPTSPLPRRVPAEAEIGGAATAVVRPVSLPPAPGTSSLRSPVRAARVAMATAAGVVLAIGGAWWVLQGRSDPPAIDATVEGSSLPAPVPAAVPPPASAPVASPVPAVTVSVTGPASPAAAKPKARASSSTSSDSGRVAVVGAAGDVALVSGRERFGPGSVPAGTYKVMAAFGDAAPVVAGQVKVAAGEDVTVRCNASFKRCMQE